MMDEKPEVDRYSWIVLGLFIIGMVLWANDVRVAFKDQANHCEQVCKPHPGQPYDTGCMCDLTSVVRQ